ncbi:hypothetical protein C2E23DRAFT_853473 [Lenzites betulinus]|nr:hypothetical protein C2E23DRAFT_853473 [Lenzites betulinus]
MLTWLCARHPGMRVLSMFSPVFCSCSRGWSCLCQCWCSCADCMRYVVSSCRVLSLVSERAQQSEAVGRQSR